MILPTKNYLKIFLLLLLKNINFYQVAAQQEQLICVIERKQISYLGNMKIIALGSI